MRLPDTNAITLPEDNAGVLVADATDPPVAWWNLEALRQYLPGRLRDGDLRVRDAVLKALGRMVALAWAGSSRALNAQQSPRHAAGAALAEHGRARKLPRAPGEDEAGHRERLLTVYSRITPAAVKDAVKAVCTRAGVRVFFQEPQSNGWFFGGDATDWMPFFSGAQRWFGEDPDADADPDIRSAGYWMGDALIPLLWIILCAPPDADESAVYFSANPTTDAGFFLGGSIAVGGYFSGGESVDSQIVHELAARLGAGVSWVILFDPIARDT